MTDRIKVYPAGTILILTEGSYSDYGICGQLVTLTECDMPALAEEYSASFVAKDEWDSVDEAGFCAWLVVTQKCAPLESQELHIGTNQFGNVTV